MLFRSTALYVFAGFFMMAIYNCKKASTDDAVTKRYDEVVAVHDEAMAKMGNISRNIKALRNLKDNDADNKKLMELLGQLESAHEGMMDWMSNFDKPDLSDATVAMPYLDDQMERIEVVQDQINSALSESTRFIRQFNIPKN